MFKHLILAVLLIASIICEELKFGTYGHYVSVGKFSVDFNIKTNICAIDERDKATGNTSLFQKLLEVDLSFRFNL
jgi:hypothetical protein